MTVKTYSGVSQNNESTIERCSFDPEIPYFIVSRDLAQDSSISLQARGLLQYFLSLPKDWQIYHSQVQKSQNIGEKKLNGMMEELINAGYASRERLRGQKGRFGNYKYTIRAVKKILPDAVKQAGRSSLLKEDLQSIDGTSILGLPEKKQKDIAEKTESISDLPCNVKENPDKNRMNRKPPLSSQKKEDEFCIDDALAFCESVGLNLKRKDFEIWSKKHTSHLIYSTLTLLLDESKNPKSNITSHAKYMQKALDDNWTQQRKNMEINADYARKMKKEYLWPDLVITKQYCRDERQCIDWSFNKDHDKFKKEFDSYMKKRIEAYYEKKGKHYD